MIGNRLRMWMGGKTFRVRVNDEILRLPRQLYGEIGVDMGMRRGTYFEVPAMEGLRRVLRPGDCVVDAGCSFGILTCLMARMVGAGGSVHCFEANEEVLGWAREIVKENVPGGGVRFVHACLSDRTGGEADFYVVPGKWSVASTRNTDIVQFHPESERRRVPMLTLDDYCEGAGIAPRCIKLDVEGSECLVLEGARKTLERHHPALVVETHGLEIEGIGGSVGELCAALEGMGYELTDLVSLQRVTGEEYSRENGSRIWYFLAV